MKKTLFFVAIMLYSITAIAQTDNGWEPWQKTSCYSKIWFRLKDGGMRGEQHYWKIQFKSDFDQLISFNYYVADKLTQYDTTTHRKTLNAKEVSNEIEVFTESEDVYLLVDKVSLSAYPRDFIDCN
ncbi:hypothetical protein [Flavobacterium rhizosphaerae]|uniref:Uncharacterized protein n=1 Tax=Flavobacterium rhizosphaerae TaxID=3163298 RepID=A0ABW8YX75_9FLAO